MKYLIVLLWLMFFGVPASAQSLKSILKSLNKKDYSRLKKQLDKSLSKEAKNPVLLYGKSLYFFDKKNHDYQIDTAY